MLTDRFVFARLLICSIVTLFCVGSIAEVCGQRSASADEQPAAIELSDKHNEAVNRKRRIVLQYDARSEMHADFKDWIEFRFAYLDEPGNQTDCVLWDIHSANHAIYPSKVLKPSERAGLLKWQDQGIDLVQEVIDETRKRGLEVFWSYRMNPFDGWNRLSEMKKAHPDWVLDAWLSQKLWNYAAPGLRQYKMDILTEVAENYEFDGFHLDFARHVPFLPAGKQWENREALTDMVRRVRQMTLEIEKKRGRPFLLAVKVPHNLKGCRTDGFDVETWAQENLVDIFTLGSRTMDVDLAAFRRIIAGRNIKLQPCFDDHHATDAYQFAPIEFLRGVYANWWQQGADSVVTSNWANAPPELSRKIGVDFKHLGKLNPGTPAQRQAYHEVGSPQTLAFKDKFFAVERRGAFIWAIGYFNLNPDSPLPVTLANDGALTSLRVKIGDNLRAHADKVKQVVVRAVLFGAGEKDNIELRLNGAVLPLAVRDHKWKDAHIFSPKPQPPAGSAGGFKVNPNQKLLRLDFTASPLACRLGENQVDLRILDADSRHIIVLEKLEIHIDYKKGEP